MSLDCTSGIVSEPVQVSEGELQTLTVMAFNTAAYGNTTCTVIESGLPSGYYQVSASEGCQVEVVEDDGVYGCEFVNAPLRTTFEVTKDFDDENPADVEVTISCNTGLPLEQSTTISEGDGVNFVVGAP